MLNSQEIENHCIHLIAAIDLNEKKDHKSMIEAKAYDVPVKPIYEGLPETMERSFYLAMVKHDLTNDFACMVLNLYIKIFNV